MTIKAREKICDHCSSVYKESKNDSNKQWEERSYCSMKCNNSSQKRVTSIFTRIARFQVVESGCWRWTGSTDGNGYPTISNRKGAQYSPEKAHRASYEKAFGPIPTGLVIRHTCDNPECTNPAHLVIGTQKDNMQDCSKRGRINNRSINNLIAGAKGYTGAAIDKNKVKKCHAE